MKLFPFQAVYPEFKLVASTDSFIKSVKNQYGKYRKTGFFRRSSQDAIYIHEIEKNGKIYRGIIASIDIEEFKSNNILVHEKTIAAKRQITMELILDRNAIIKPILVAYNNRKGIDQLVQKVVSSQKPHYQTKFDENGIIHRFYQISDGSEVEKLLKLFAKIKTGYIADGHHRRATILDLYKSGQIGDPKSQRKTMLSALFPFSDLEIHDFNRVVDVFDLKSPTNFIIHLAKYCKIKNLKKGRKPKNKFEITAFLNGEWISIKWRNKILETHKDVPVLLDAELLDHYVFGKILGIEDVKQTTRIKYVEGVKDQNEIINMVNADFKKMVFFIYPVSKEELKQVAEEKLSLPPKSTWFEPRLKNGLISEDF